MAFIDYMGELFLFFVDASRSLVHPPWFVREVIAQMYHLGVRSFSLVAVASFALGLAGIMLASRGGAGMGAELGSMRVTSQIDALTVSAVNPIKYLVVTRIVACMLVLPLLTVAANLIGILGGMVIGVTQLGMTPTYYYTLTIKYLTLKDVLPGIGKTTIFGLIIGTVSCFHGFNTQHGTFGVGQSTKTSVVASILLILIADVFLTKLILLLWP
jgi:phospholipid/cholesterol/gamma-HCH transport system permease protein